MRLNPLLMFILVSVTSASDELHTRLAAVCAKHRIPAMAGAIVTSQGLAQVAAVGQRKTGNSQQVTVGDKWHLGSNTKAMTSVLIARLVEEGNLTWQTPIAAVFADAHPEMRGVTLLQLLSHQASLPRDSELNDGSRKQVALEAVTMPPGRQERYSNLGYIVAGAIAEAMTGDSWEDAMRERVFAPLGMDSAGFGGTGTLGELDQPWPHRADGSPAPENGPEIDNPAYSGPAGRVHCTIRDWARFIQDQLKGARGKPALLRAQSYLTLHRASFGGEFALGWVVANREWGGGTVLMHAGDNTLNHALVWMAPKRDFAVLVCANQGGEQAAAACDAAAGALINLHLADSK
jgi:CubicO group peptidase (beta-lactamase class C family)